MKEEDNLLPLITAITEAIINTINCIARAKYKDEEIPAHYFFIRNILINVIGNYILAFTNFQIAGALEANVKMIHTEIDEFIETAKQLKLNDKEKMQ